MKGLRTLPPPDPDELIALRAMATKIVTRAAVGRRWYFHNGICVAFFRAPERAP